MEVGDFHTHKLVAGPSRAHGSCDMVTRIRTQSPEQKSVEQMDLDARSLAPQSSTVQGNELVQLESNSKARVTTLRTTPSQLLPGVGFPKRPLYKTLPCIIIHLPKEAA